MRLGPRACVVVSAQRTIWRATEARKVSPRKKEGARREEERPAQESERRPQEEEEASAIVLRVLECMGISWELDRVFAPITLPPCI